MEKDRRQRNILGPVTVGMDDSGHDVTFYGATAGCKLLWDESLDKLHVQGILNVNGAVTLETAGRVYKEIHIMAKDWDVTGSGAAVGQHTSRFPTILVTPTETASTTENLYATVPAPNDIDVTASMRGTIIWSFDTAQASAMAQFTVNASMWGAGEVNAGTTYAGTATKNQCSASEANSFTWSNIMTDMDPPAVGDLLGLHVEYQSAGSSTTGSDLNFHGMIIRYTANKLGAAT